MAKVSLFPLRYVCFTGFLGESEPKYNQLFLSLRFLVSSIRAWDEGVFGAWGMGQRQG